MPEKKGNNKWVYLPIETKVRELDAKLLLTYYAVQQGYRVVLGLSGMVEQALEYLPKGIFLDKGYTCVDKVRRFEMAKSKGHTVVNLEEEGFPLTEKELYLKKHVSRESLDLLDYELCWGEVQKNTIIRAYPGVRNKCLITGNPRLDLLKKKYRTLFEKKALAIKKKYGDFILVNTRFPLYTKSINDDGTLNRKVVANLRKAYGEKIHKKMTREYKDFIIMIKKASTRYPNLTFVIRPHPSDKFNVYQQDLVECKNVYVVHEDNVVNWIMASKLVIHTGCTTGVESFLLERPVISYVTTVEDTFDLPNELSIKVHNLDELFQFMDHEMDSYNFHRHKFNEDKKLELLSKHYAAARESYAYENILQVLNKLPVAESPLTRVPRHTPLLNKLRKESNKRIYQVNTIVKQKFPHLTVHEIEDFFKALNHIEKANHPIVIRKLHDKLFEITPG
ncbi:surface carbohydrate biosynthesis protein [Halobacillus sp. Marseille-Q1614]|uniref:surface carbohydrate biosynthesis protein n=1 Tax=Halobacillus sp. Marseille-Q1614 TaxID=2709134 RepID=UPI00156E313A|nr:surface carbohydrate biosynthesis protein [Halobacillus sp. Marseille-Q1614]